MPIERDDDLLFGVTALQLRFVTQEQLVEATSAPPGKTGASLRERLCSLNLLNAAEAEAVAAVVAQRMARFGNDARKAVDSVAPIESALLTGVDRAVASTVREGQGRGANKPNQPAPVDRFVTVPESQLRSSQGERYVVLRTWQQGGLGRVAIALDRELNREIALKEIQPAYADHEENRRRFVREAEVTGALEHPGVVPVYSLGEFPDGRPYYAMRFIRGSNLHLAIEDHFAKTPPEEMFRGLEFRQLLGRFVDVCHTIGYAHSRGVLHRDIKPANIMLGEYGESLVVDWGLARLAGKAEDSLDSAVPQVSSTDRSSGSYTQAGRVVGTPAYMSPEQAQGRLDLLGPASDIYCLGATLYHMLVGLPPFQGDADDLPHLVQAARFKPPRERRAEVPRPLEAICLKAMALRPADRYATAGELALEMERYLAEEPVSAYPEPLPARAWRWVRRHRSLVASFMTATLVTVAALAAGIVLLSAANRRESAALDRAEANLVEANAQRERAERNFARAQEAVQNYYVRVSEETLLNQPGMQPLRDALLRQALEYYQEFLEERGDDPTLAREAAKAEYFTGRLVETIGDPAEAVSHYERAIALTRELVGKGAPTPAAEGPGRASDADHDEPQTLLARCLNALGGAFQRLQRFDEAKKNFQEAADLRQALATSAPDDPERARELASSLMNLGQLAAFQQDFAAALPLLEQAQALRLARYDADASPALVRDLGQGHYNLALVRFQTGDDAAAQDELEAAVSAFERVLAIDPHDQGNLRRLAASRRLLADLHAGLGDEQAAAENYRQAAEPLELLVLRNPEVVDFAADLAGVEMNLAELLAAAGEPEPALTEIDKAIARLERISELAAATDRHRHDLGVALRFAGERLRELERPVEAIKRLQAARDQFAALVRQHPDDPQYAADLRETTRLLDQTNAL